MMPRLPPPVTWMAAAVALIAAATTAYGLVRDLAEFDGSAIGSDPPSEHERRFARMRDRLPPGATVGYVDDLDDDKYAEQRRQTAQGLAAALHHQLQTGEVAVGTGTTYMAILEELYRIHFPKAETHDLSVVTANVISLWIGEARKQRLSLLRYTLAPNVVSTEPGPLWIIGDFTPDFDYTTLAAAKKLTVVEDFGRGAVLFSPSK